MNLFCRHCKKTIKRDAHDYKRLATRRGYKSYCVSTGKRTYLIKAAALALFLSLNGCASMFACTTDASYILRADGTKEVHYSSCKEQIGLEATFDGVSVKVDKSSTQEAVIAATLQLQSQMVQMLRELSAKGAGS